MIVPKMSEDDFRRKVIINKYLWWSIAYQRLLTNTTDRELKNLILIALFMENDETVKVVFDYWNEKIKEFTTAFINVHVDFFNEIMEDYYRSVITDNWADEVGLKYYY